MKKYAFMLMGNKYDTDKHQAVFKTDNMISYIHTVTSFTDAKKRLMELIEKGVGAVEVCGAFSDDNVLEMIKMTDNKVVIAKVTNRPEQDELVKNFFS